MAKWLVLAAGVFLFFNGMMSRTYSYTSEPVTHCFNMDYIRVFGCFSSPVVPIVITWGAALIGAGLIAWSFIRGRRQNV
jgi:hypothetical protein